jgi:hypothetical protein
MTFDYFLEFLENFSRKLIFSRNFSRKIFSRNGRSLTAVLVVPQMSCSKRAALAVDEQLRYTTHCCTTCTVVLHILWYYTYCGTTHTVVLHILWYYTYCGTTHTASKLLTYCKCCSLTATHLRYYNYCGTTITVVLQ